ncbi:MAG: ion channel [Chitinophagales bacterium]|jgi:hypothetical protein|nr:ion channel [Chitinophagales bacterium]
MIRKISLKTLKKLDEYWLEDASFVFLLIILICMVFLMPIFQFYYPDAIYIHYFFVLFLYFSGIFSCYNLWIKGLLAILYFVFVVLKFIRLFQGVEDYFLYEIILSIFSLVFMILNNFRLLFRNDHINIYRIVGAVNIYLLVAVYGAFFLQLLNQFYYPVLVGNVTLTNSDIDFNEFLNYSLTCLTTVGFGDVFTKNIIVKQLSVFLSTFGILYPALVIAHLLNRRK